MKKIIIGSVLSLFIGGLTFAAVSTFNMDFAMNKSTLNQTLAQEVPQIMSWGNDEGGFYYIMKDSNSCWKWYPKSPRQDIQGIVE